jgi:hypothetical protein
VLRVRVFLPMTQSNHDQGARPRTAAGSAFGDIGNPRACECPCCGDSCRRSCVAPVSKSGRDENDPDMRQNNRTKSLSRSDDWRSATIRRIMPHDGKADGKAPHEQKGGFRSPGPHHDRRQVYRGRTGGQRCSARLCIPSAPRACHERSFPARKICDVASCHLRTGETYA